MIGNKITEIPPAERFSLCLGDRLRLLELGSNRIRQLRALDGFTALQSLWVGKNKITRLENLNLPSLKILSIQV